MADDLSEDFTVPGLVPKIVQQGHTCWAAAAAMMIGWRTQQSCSMDAAIATLGEDILWYWKKRQVLPHETIPDLAGMAGMQCEPLRSFTPQQFLELMKKTPSPLMMCLFWPNSTNQTHFDVVFKIRSGGNGAALVTYNDPMTGEENEDDFQSFRQQVEAALDRPGMKGQMLHY
jgi:hypothetical protein